MRICVHHDLQVSSSVSLFFLNSTYVYMCSSTLASIYQFELRVFEHFKRINLSGGMTIYSASDTGSKVRAPRATSLGVFVFSCFLGAEVGKRSTFWAAEDELHTYIGGRTCIHMRTLGVGRGIDANR